MQLKFFNHIIFEQIFGVIIFKAQIRFHSNYFRKSFTHFWHLKCAFVLVVDYTRNLTGLFKQGSVNVFVFSLIKTNIKEKTSHWQLICFGNVNISFSFQRINFTQRFEKKSQLAIEFLGPGLNHLKIIFSFCKLYGNFFWPMVNNWKMAEKWIFLQNFTFF